VISRYLFKESFFVDLKTTDFGRKRENAVSTNKRLQQEAQAVLDVIENLKHYGKIRTRIFSISKTITM